MSVSIRVQVNIRKFQYKDYKVMVKDLYSPYADSAGYPSNFELFYTTRNIDIPEGLSILGGEAHTRFMIENGISYQMMEGSSLFKKRNINWAIEEAKKLIE